ncbi:Alkaline ceramidase 3 [Boothiomyces macroporosus]|uniref:Alkaline ceramidase 3 n=1 Tax=Boothiomyces macroporosus TaxID=261099 RepID=A0AAD5UGS4_9FUNG|nr:Alkaline ceramidase 3 [Boothiomyces macroporosus]
MFSIERSEYPFDPLNKQGYWGNATSTLDWCEPDYVVVFRLTLGFLALYSAIQVKLETREHSGTLALVVIGMGSWLFHMTLLYSTQLCDELPMIYGTCLCLYNVLTLYDKHSKKSIAGLVAYSVVITAVYVALRIPLIFQFSYALLALVFAIIPIRQTFALKSKHPKDVKILIRMYCFNLSMFLLAFVCWNIDNNVCDHLRAWRDTVPWYLGMFSQMHGWWHMLTGLGCYGQIVHSRYLRCLVKGIPVRLVFIGPYPTLVPKEEDLEKQGSFTMDKKPFN